MTETRIRVEPSNLGKVLGWGSVGAGVLGLAGLCIAFAVGLQGKMESGHTDLNTRIDALTKAVSNVKESQVRLDTEIGTIRTEIARDLGYHQGEHGRIEGAADTLEGILRGLTADE